MKQMMLSTAMALALASGAMAQDTTGMASTSVEPGPGMEATQTTTETTTETAVQATADQTAADTEVDADAGEANTGLASTGLASTGLASSEPAADTTSTTVIVPMDSASAAAVEDGPIGTVEPEAGVSVGAPVAEGLRVPAFRASEFAGTTLFAIDPQAVSGTQGQPRWNSSEQVLGARENWQKVGEINDTILSQDGAVRGVLVDVGGFLGIGERTVLIDINDLYFVPNAETANDPDDFYAVAGLTREQMGEMPQWAEDNLVAGYPWGDTPSNAALDAQSSDSGMTEIVESRLTEGEAPAVPAEGMGAVNATAEDLTGALVVDAEGDTVGRVQDLVLNGETVEAVVLDVGGFLGIGAHTVALPVNALKVVRHDNGQVDKVQTASTRAELEAMPVYQRP